MDFIAEVPDYGHSRVLTSFPAGGGRAVPPEVPEAFASDFREAASILNLSPRASAALSRSCLERVMVDVAKAKGRNLYLRIEAAIKTQGYNSVLREQLHQIRETGNYALHIKADKATGEIVDVGTDEAEWNLDILELLFDHHFVLPAKSAKMAKAWAEKKKGKAAPKAPPTDPKGEDTLSQK
jgi:hypothetical protein